MKVKAAQSCPILCDPMDYTIRGIFQARILEWVAFPFSRVSSQPRSPAVQADSLPAGPQGKPKVGKNFCLATIITRDTLLFHSQQKMDKKLCCCGCRKVAKWFSNTLCNLVPHPLHLTGHKHLSVKYGLTFRSSQS